MSACSIGSAHVAVIGATGACSELVKNILLAGVGQVTIFDARTLNDCAAWEANYFAADASAQDDVRVGDSSETVVVAPILTPYTS